jgi:hypothetical protein
MQIGVAAPSPRVGDGDVGISTGYIRGQGGSIGRLRHLKHHRFTQAMAVHHTRRTLCWWVDFSDKGAAADTAEVTK